MAKTVGQYPVNLGTGSGTQGGVGEHGHAGVQAKSLGSVRGRYSDLRQLLAGGVYVHSAIRVRQHLARQAH